MSWLATRIAASSSGASTTYAQCRTISLDMAKTLAVITLLGYSKVSPPCRISARCSRVLFAYCQSCEGVDSRLIHVLIRPLGMHEEVYPDKGAASMFTGLFA